MTAHAANTGAMLGCDEPGSRVWLRDTGDPGRKYPLSWELVEVAGGVLVGTNTALANPLVAEGIRDGTISELKGFDRIRPEVPYGDHSRIDLLLEKGSGDDGGRTAPGRGQAPAAGSCYVEVKNATMVTAGVARFPDSVSVRATRHLGELEKVAAAGYRAVVLFCLQREDAGEFRPADDIDPVFGQALRQAEANGVEVMAYAAGVSISGIRLSRMLPVVLS